MLIVHQNIDKEPEKMIIFDLDGTLANCEHRRHFIDVKEAMEKGFAYEDTYCDMDGYQSRGYFFTKDIDRRWKPNWQAFYEACTQDSVNEYVRYVMEGIHYGHEKEMEIWSGRCESVRDKTEVWLDKHIPKKWYQKLQMRPIGDNTPDDVLKERWLDEYYNQGDCGLRWATHDKCCRKIDFVFDDRPKVVRMWRRRGIFVFNCAQSDGEF